MTKVLSWPWVSPRFNMSMCLILCIPKTEHIDHWNMRRQGFYKLQVKTRRTKNLTLHVSISKDTVLHSLFCLRTFMYIQIMLAVDWYFKHHLQSVCEHLYCIMDSDYFLRRARAHNQDISADRSFLSKYFPSKCIPYNLLSAYNHIMFMFCNVIMVITYDRCHSFRPAIV